MTRVLALLIGIVIGSPSLAGANIQDLRGLCKKVGELNKGAAGNQIWNINDTDDVLSKLLKIPRRIIFKGVEIPVVKGELLEVDQVSQGGIATTKLIFSTGVTEVRLIENSDVYINDIASHLVVKSPAMGNQLLSFVNEKRFIDKLKWYAQKKVGHSSCLDEPVEAWSRVYVENVLASGTMMMDRDTGMSLFGDGLLYRLRGYEGFGFISMTDDRNYLIQVVGYRE
ncbi:hypothetical protein [Microbulbifer thermotolerans]|uniref:hypothetical protein n=1 Tax=Microbulbifer thermotolerans TaxID=252514 RepID=UPI00224982C5|nr:hypothetical protein [Microbulbifer thermotolerans]MCX2832335.1 hypothetical protein [Microbulbifer thermotolerans]